jgi:hypothetical protein
VVLTPRRWRQVSWSDLRSDGDNKARSPGRARRKPLKPLRREGRAFRRTCGFYPCAFLLHRGLRVRQAPGFPCALCSLRDKGFCKTRTHRAAGSRKCVFIFFVIARSESDEAIHSYFIIRRDGLLRGACHRAALCADPLARNDEPLSPHVRPSYPRKRVSSTPRPGDLIAGGSGILDRPVKAGR